jgi:hypothetical protein
MAEEHTDFDIAQAICMISFATVLSSCDDKKREHYIELADQISSRICKIFQEWKESDMDIDNFMFAKGSNITTANWTWTNNENDL